MTAAAAAAAVADREAVTRVLVRYAHTVDDRDLEATGECFTEDAEASYGGRRLEPGRAGIVTYLRARTSALRASTHLLGNILVEVAGDTAHAVTDGVAYLVFEPGAGHEPVVRVRGLRYDDDLVRDGGSWRIRNRVHVSRWMFDATALDPAAHKPPTAV